MNQDEPDKSAREQEWPDSLDAMVAAPEHIPDSSKFMLHVYVI